MFRNQVFRKRYRAEYTVMTQSMRTHALQSHTAPDVNGTHSNSPA